MQPATRWERSRWRNALQQVTERRALAALRWGPAGAACGASSMAFACARETGPFVCANAIHAGVREAAIIRISITAAQAETRSADVCGLNSRPRRSSMAMRLPSCEPPSAIPEASSTPRREVHNSNSRARLAAYGRAAPVAATTQSSQASSRSRSIWRSTHAATGWSASTAPAIRARRLVQSSRRAICASSCSRT